MKGKTIIPPAVAAALLLALSAVCGEKNGGADPAETRPVLIEQFKPGEKNPSEPEGWKFQAWERTNSSEKFDTGLVEEPGGPVLNIPAVSEGWIGWVSPGQYLAKKQNLYISGECRGTAKPNVYITWYNGYRFLDAKKMWPISSRKDQWTKFDFTVPFREFPKDADGFKLNLCVEKKQTGAVGYRNVRVTTDKPDQEAGFVITGNRFANWWVIGEKVKFHLQGSFPSGYTVLRGSVCDAEDRPVGNIDVPVGNGDWEWQPEQPGFYVVKFELTGPSKPLLAVRESYQCRWQEKTQEFFRDRVNVGVLPATPRSPEQVSPLFGMHLKYSWYSRSYWETQKKLIELLENRLVRFHFVEWTFLEKEKGRYEWSLLDDGIDWSQKKGYSPIINFYGIPRWASPHPEENHMQIAMFKYATYFPRDIGEWSNFVRTLVERYRTRVKKWEVFNEPNFKGSSVFWNGTPEEYVEMLKTAYRTIKTVQPDSEVWASGFGDQYLAFFNRIIGLGAGQNYDKLSLHGFRTFPEPFWSIDRKHKITPHPAVSSEWHGTLVTATDSDLLQLGDPALSMRMLKGLMNQVRHGVESVIFFEILDGTEPEELSFYRANGRPWAHSSGLFRAKPSLQPRFQAVVYDNFVRQFSGKIEFLGQYLSGSRHAVLLESRLGKVLVFWQEQAAPQPPDPALTAVMGPDSKLSDWQGREIPSSGHFLLMPRTMYYLANPLPSVSAWTQAVYVLEPEKKPLVLHGPEGKFTTLPILAGTPVWNSSDWNTGSAGSAAPKFAVSVTADSFELIVDVADGQFFNEEEPAKMYRGDSVQFSFDSRGRGYPEDRIQFQMSKIHGKNCLYKEYAPDPGANLPSEWTFPGGVVADADMQIDSRNGRTVYRLKLPLSELYPLSPAAAERIRFSLLVNENDGSGRKGWIEWGGGIGLSKDPTLYGTLKKESRR